MAGDDPDDRKTGAAFPLESSKKADKTGGEGGIRTHGKVSPTHAFQACSLSHSDTSPLRRASDGQLDCMVQRIESAREEPAHLLLEFRSSDLQEAQPGNDHRDVGSEEDQPEDSAENPKILSPNIAAAVINRRRPRRVWREDAHQTEGIAEQQRHCRRRNSGDIYANGQEYRKQGT